MNKISALMMTGSAAMVLTASAANVDWSKLPPASTKTGVTFANDIAPMFKESCVRCHGANRPRANLRLDSLDGVMKGTEKGPILTAGDSANSLLVKSVSQLDPQIAMPPKPRGPRGPRNQQGTNAPAMPPQGGPGGGPPDMQPRGDGGPGPGGPGGGEGDRPPGGPQGTNGNFQTRLRPMGPPPKPLTAEQVGLIRAWIDQGAK